MRRPAPRASDKLDAGRRARDLDELAAGHEVDVLVVGGGVTGAGVALDAASRGLSVALIERRDLANGTSRWSSKLVHGGLRYLNHGQFGVAWESARERAILMDRTAPHLVRALPMVLPLTAEVTHKHAALYELGIRIGDGLRAAAGSSRRRLPPTRRISAEEARRWAPHLDPAGLRGAILHWDGQLEDDARLVVALARTAGAHGARILTYVQATALHGDGAQARDTLTGHPFALRARHVVNATGVWAGALAPAAKLRPSKGSHLLVPAARLGDPRAALDVPIPQTFGRFVFAVPRSDGLVLVGLTDRPYDGELPDAPEVSGEEEDMLLQTLSRALQRPLDRSDVVGRFAGLRPLLAGAGATADLSRRHAVLEDPAGGVITVVGGKLTTYRRMAQDAVDRIAARPGCGAGCSRTRRLPLVGAGCGAAAGAGEIPPRLVRRYGTEAPAVAALADSDPGLLRPVAPGVPVLGVELAFALQSELALTLEDLVDRRTRAGLVPEWRTAALRVAARLAPDLPPAAGERHPAAAAGR